MAATAPTNQRLSRLCGRPNWRAHGIRLAAAVLGCLLPALAKYASPKYPSIRIPVVYLPKISIFTSPRVCVRKTSVCQDPAVPRGCSDENRQKIGSHLLYVPEQSSVMELRKRVEKFALHKAVTNSDVVAVRETLARGSIDLDEKDAKKNTPLYIAVEKNNPEIVRILLEAGADLNVKAGPGNSPLHLAVSENNERIFKILLDAGADIQTKNNFEKTPLHIAAKNGNREIIRLLLEAGAQVNEINFSGMTPLYEAVCSIFNCKEEIVRLLLGSGADVSIKNWDGDTALQYALDKENFGVATILIEAGLDVNSQNKSGKTVLHFAAMQCKNAIIEYLLSHKIDTNIKDFGQEWTAMHWAAFKNKGTSHLKTIELLVQNGADIYAKNDKGETPFEILTKKTSDTETLELFLKCMTKDGDQEEISGKKKRKIEDLESEEEKEPDQPNKCSKVEKKENLTIADMFKAKTLQKQKEENDNDVIVIEKETCEISHDTLVDMIKKIKTEVAEIRKEQSEEKNSKVKLEQRLDEVCKENKDLKSRISSLEAELKKKKKKEPSKATSGSTKKSSKL